MKKKYDSWTAKEKLQIIEYAEKFGNRAAGRHFNLGESNVRNWRRNADRLKTMPATKRANRGATSAHPDMEKELYNWVCDRRDEGLGVTTTEIRLRASYLCRTKYAATQFKALLGWCYRFMRRHQLSIRRRTTISQRLPDDYEEKLTNFQSFIIKQRQKYDIDPSRIGNADQTPLTFDLPYETTVTHTNSKTVSIRTTGNEKNRFTVMLGCMADGTKLPPYVIFKRKTLPKGDFPADVIVRVHEKGWMAEQSMKEWLRLVWGKRPNTRQKSLLVLDSFQVHRMESIKRLLKDDRTELAIIPGGMTSILQPLDVGVNKPMKTALRQMWNNWMCADEHTYTKGGRLRKPDLPLICTWISKAWRELDPAIITRSFLKCSISNRLDGTEDDMLWKEDGVPDEKDDVADPNEVYYNDRDDEFDADAFFHSDDDEEFWGFDKTD